jgi:hypothetical protein
MSKKVLNTHSVINELKGQSAFFKREPEPEHPAAEKPRPAVISQTNKETRKLASKQPYQEPTQENSLQPSGPIKPEFYRKQTFEFTKDDMYFLDDAKLACKRRYGFRTTKNDIVRTALEFLKKDLETNKETSFLVRKFTGKEAY